MYQFASTCLMSGNASRLPNRRVVTVKSLPTGEIPILTTPGRGYEVRTELVERLSVRIETIKEFALVG